MRSRTVALIFSGLLLAPCARADFVLAGQQPAAPARSSPAPSAFGARSPEIGGQRLAGSAKISRAAEPEFMVAEGFGDRVPLRFAVRQIVPRAVRVTYGPGADPNADVDWKGGQGWNQVLLRAVKPLGLRLVMTHMAVEIRK